MTPRPPGFVQVDVDGLWAVRQCYGRPENDTFTEDLCWKEGVEQLDNVFQHAGIEAAFFVVGRDLELDAKRRSSRKLLHRGYELGNHSYSHHLGLTLKTAGSIVSEIARTHRALTQIGASPSGFRSPGYDIDSRVLRAVIRCGYTYDASMLPTWAGPLLRTAQAMLAGRWISGRRQYGRISHFRAPRGPYLPRLYKVRKPRFERDEKRLVEIPVGVTPRLSLPLTASALFPLGRRRVREIFDELAARGEPTLLLLHAIDGVDCSQPIIFDNKRPDIGGFAMTGEQKQKRLAMIVEEFSSRFAITRADRFAAAFLSGAAPDHE